MSQNKGNEILMYAWVIIGILSLAAAIHKSFRFGLNNSLGLYLIALLAFGLFYFRRRIKKSGD